MSTKKKNSTLARMNRSVIDSKTKMVYCRLSCYHELIPDKKHVRWLKWSEVSRILRDFGVSHQNDVIKHQLVVGPHYSHIVFLGHDQYLSLSLY